MTIPVGTYKDFACTMTCGATNGATWTGTIQGISGAVAFTVFS